MVSVTQTLQVQNILGWTYGVHFESRDGLCDAPYLAVTSRPGHVAIQIGTYLCDEDFFLDASTYPYIPLFSYIHLGEYLLKYPLDNPWQVP